MIRIVIIRLLLIVFTLSLFTSGKVGASSNSKQPIAGKVMDMAGDPVIGATVVFYAGGEVLSACPTDSAGRFTETIMSLNDNSLMIKVSSVGFEPQAAVVSSDESCDTVIVDFQLQQISVHMGTIKVQPKREQAASTVSLGQRRIAKAAVQSLIPTNPTSAIKQPQVVREGSNHSSKINVNGTQPEYYINGIEIGCNPNHYGVFSIIPASVIKGMTFHPQGTSAHLGSPSAIELSTGHPFQKHSHGEVNLSMVEVTGSFSIGSPQYFILGSLRKSILDKLVRQFEIQSDRRTMPPTNFQDIFASSGLRVSGHHHLVLDQYHVQDFLSYGIEATAGNPYGVDTYLHTNEHYVGLRWDAAYDKMLLKVKAAVQLSHEEYQASSLPGEQADGVKLDLTADRQANLGYIEMCFPLGSGLLTLGNQLEYVSHSEVNMTQYSWNFRPPDANSDNPFIYQAELNQLYGTYSGSRRELNNAAYVSVTQSFFGIRFETGVRAEYFRNLDNGTALLFRNRATIETGEVSELSLFLGSFAENPANKILEPYQVLIHVDYNRLKPVQTQLASANLSVGKVGFGLFAKWIDNLPAATVDFAHVNADGSVKDGFITMQPNDRLAFYGGDITLDLDSLWSPRVDFYAFYGYTHGEKIVSGMTIPYELNSPHKLFMQATYRLSQVISVSSEANIRTGFPYTPTRSASFYYDEHRLSEQYYESVLSAENEARFPLNAVLNAHINFDFGNSELFITVANVTGRVNPIVNTSDGFIYDAGILPSVGFRWRF